MNQPVRVILWYFRGHNQRGHRQFLRKDTLIYGWRKQDQKGHEFTSPEALIRAFSFEVTVSGRGKLKVYWLEPKENSTLKDKILLMKTSWFITKQKRVKNYVTRCNKHVTKCFWSSFVVKATDHSLWITNYVKNKQIFSIAGPWLLTSPIPPDPNLIIILVSILIVLIWRNVLRVRIICFFTLFSAFHYIWRIISALHFKFLMKFTGQRVEFIINQLWKFHRTKVLKS